MYALVAQSRRSDYNNFLWKSRRSGLRHRLWRASELESFLKRISALVAQLDRASAYGAEGSEFKSRRARV